MSNGADHHINRLKKIYVILPTEAEKVFDKIKHTHFYVKKNLSKLEMENVLNFIKIMFKNNPTTIFKIGNK